MLSKDKFAEVIERTPLISIDLIICNPKSECLLGLRRYKPAQGFWFVPGGRIFKNETLENAFARISETELGQEFSIAEATLLGCFEHFYDDCAFGDIASTHYVVLAYTLTIENLSELPSSQHQAYRWAAANEILTDAEVHTHTKAYFVANN